VSEPVLVREGAVNLWHGDALEVLQGMPEASVHAVITDPPYGLADLPATKVATALSAWLAGDRAYVPAAGRGMSGKTWDRFVPPPALWDEVRRVLVPGGWLACFAAPRTVDLMGMSIRLAGFEMRDQLLAWVCGSNMAKVTDSGVALERAGAPAEHAEAWRGWAPGLKAAQEPVLLARKPLEDSLLSNLVRHGAGSLHVDAVRVPFASPEDEAESKGKNQHATTTGGRTYGKGNTYGDVTMLVRADYDAPGRFPANLLACHLPDCVQDGPCVDGCPVAGLGERARFFPTFHYAGRAHVTERPVVDGVQHVTVKPLSVMAWLVDLLVAPGMHVLDPFAGSGTTGEVAAARGVQATLVESHTPYIALIEQRLDRVPELTEGLPARAA